MLNVRCLLAFLLLTFAAEAQDTWDTVSIDPHIEFTLPAEYSRTENPDMLDIQAFGNSSIMRILKIPQPETNIETTDGIKRFYESHRDMVLTRPNARLLAHKHEMTGDLKTYVFTAELNNEGVAHTQQSRLLFANHVLYVFTYGTTSEEWYSHHVEYKRFMTGIKFINLDPDDQLTIPNSNVLFGEMLGTILRYSFIAAAVLSLILWFRKKYTLVKRIKNIFGIVFMVLGGFNIVIGSANFLFGNNQWPMVIMGIVFVIIGYGLKKIPVPIRKEVG